MKRCPECRRDYFDESMLYCLDDGATLLEGPAISKTKTAILGASEIYDDPQTQILENIPSEAVTKRQVSLSEETRLFPKTETEKTIREIESQYKFLLVLASLAILVVAGFLGYRYLAPTRQVESVMVDTPNSTRTLYWQMTEAEQLSFIRERTLQIQRLIGEEPTNLDDEAIQAIKVEIDDYVEEKDSLSQKPFEEGLRVIYGRASQYTPIVIRAYESLKVSPALGLYQAMIESEYRDCPTSPFQRGPVGLFQFKPSTARKYGLTEKDYCNIEKQSDAAARYMADLLSDFGEGKSNGSLALLSFNIGEGQVRESLRQLRGLGVTERSFWVIFRHRKKLQPPLSDDIARYVPRFFAAAIIGENPEAFELSTPPLTTLRNISS